MKPINKYIKENNKKTNVYLMVGLPGSGKSEWCKRVHPELPVVSRDIIRGELGYTSGADEKAKLEYWQENEVTKKEQERIAEYLKAKQDFIIDDTNLRLKYRKPLIQSLRMRGAFVIGVRVLTPIDVCIRRRDGQISEEQLIKMEKTMNPLDRTEVDKYIEVKGTQW